MGISVIGAAASSGRGGGTNNFVLKTNTNTTHVLDRTYASGRYEISFSDNDDSYDIYAIAEDGTYAGYTNSSILEASADFSEIVVLGAAHNIRITFTHVGVISEAVSSGDVATAGAFVGSVVTSSLPSTDDTTVVNGGNFAANVEVSFIGQSAVETAAKTVVRSSSTQLIVTRPDAFSPDDSPYTVKVVNPGIPVPAGSNAHLLSNSVTAGTNPVWTTPTTVGYSVGAATSVTLLATDTEASDIDYSVVSGTLPAGLTLDGETGVISGTASGTPAEGDVTAVTIRAIDTGGNFLDRAFNFTANVAPTWTTAAGAINDAAPDGAYTFALVASTGSAGGALTYTLQSGALLPGHSLSSSGVISGTSTGVIDDTATFTVRVTDEGGLFADRSFTTTIFLRAAGGTVTEAGGYFYHTFTGSGNFVSHQALSLDVLIVAGAGGAGTIYDIWSGGGGGGGGFQDPTYSTSANTTYNIVVGAGGGVAINGSNSSAFGTTSTGGGSGALTPDYSSSNNKNGASGGSGGGGSYMTLSVTSGYGDGGAGIAGQGYAGGNAGGGHGGGGGGAGSGGQSGNYQGTGGSPRAWYDSVGYARGGNGAPSGAVVSVPGAANTGNGGSRYGAGGSGIVIVRYAA